MTKAVPRVSVCIPVYNRAAYVGDAIETVISQGFGDFELLLIDDGSTDDSVAVMRSFDDPRIRIEHNDANRGIAYSRNRAIELARAPLLTWLDSDDRMAPGRLARQVQFLDEHADIAMLGGWLQRFDDTHRFRGMQTKPLPHEQLHATLLFRTSHANTTVMARTAALRDIGHDLQFVVGSDHDLLIRFAKRYRFANLPRILAYQREHPGRITKARPDQLLLSKYRLIDRQLRELGITASQSDLARHYLLTRIKPKELAADPEYLQWAAQWLAALLAANRQARVYSDRALEGVVAQTWIETCARSVRTVGLAQVLSRLHSLPWFMRFGGCVVDNLKYAAGARS